MPYGYDPLQFRKDLSGVRQAGQQFATGIGAAVAEIPEITELRKNTEKNETIFSDDIQPRLRELDVNDLALTGFTDKATLEAAMRPEKGETNIQYVTRVARILQPIAENRAKQTGAFEEERRVKERRQEVGGQVRGAIAGEPQVGEPRQIDVPGMEGGFTEQDIAPREPATSANVARQVGPDVTTSELGDVPAYATLPTEAQTLAREKEASVQKRFEIKNRLNERKVRVSERANQIRSWGVSVQQNRVDAGVFAKITDEADASEQDVLDLTLEVGYLTEEMQDPTISGSAVLKSQKQVELMEAKNSLTKAKEHEKDMQDLRKRAKTKIGASLPPAPPPAKRGAPAVGTIQGGYRFKGGDPASQANWEKI